MNLFIADENIPRKSVGILRNAGYDVLSIGEDFPALKDIDILAMANDMNRILITCDSDFGDLIYNKGRQCLTGVIYLRLGRFKSTEPGAIVLSYLSAAPNLFAGQYSVVDRARIRQNDL